MSSYQEHPSVLHANRVERGSTDPQVTIDRSAPRRSPSRRLLERLPSEKTDEDDHRERFYLVEVRFGYHHLGPIKKPKAKAIYARPDGDVIYRLVDADETDWTPCEDDLYASILVDKEPRAPEPLGEEAVEDLRDAYRLLIEERHCVGGEQA